MTLSANASRPCPICRAEYPPFVLPRHVAHCRRHPLLAPNAADAFAALIVQAAQQRKETG